MSARTKTPAEPPSSREAELSTLGAVLINPDVFDAVAAEFSGLDADTLFHDPACGAVWEMMLTLRAKGKPVDNVHLFEMGRARPDSGVDMSFIVHLVGAVPTSANAVHYARIVVEKYRLRTMQKIGQRLLSSTARPDADAQALMLAAVEEIAGLNRAASSGPVSVADGLEDSISRILGLYERGSGGGLLTGFVGLDRVLNGLDAGTVCVIAARPSVGKTAFAINIADNAAKAGNTVLVFSIEMAKAALDDRLVFAAGGIEKAKVIDRVYGREVLVARLQEATRQSHFGRIFVCEDRRLTHFDLSSRVRAFKRERPLGLLVIDFLQLVSPSNARMSREAQVAEASREIKILAEEAGCPVLVLSQLNREAERDGEPTTAHLRESGAIEQDADVVLLLSRAQDKILRVHVGKNRNGPTGLVGLVFDRDTQRFHDWTGPIGELAKTTKRTGGYTARTPAPYIEHGYNEDPDEEF